MIIYIQFPEKGTETEIFIQTTSAKIIEINHTINFRNGIKRTYLRIRRNYYGKLTDNGERC